MADVITVLRDNVAVTQVAGAEVLLPLAIAASAENAERAEAALAEILDVASGSPEAPSIANKLDLDGGNVTDPAALLAALGAAPISTAFMQDENFVSTLPDGEGAKITFFTNSTGVEQDGIQIQATASGTTSASYPIHIILYGDADVVDGGALGVAADGDGAMPALVANKRGAGPGPAAIFTRDGTGNGAAFVATLQASSGLSVAAEVVKQNATGGGRATGPALRVQNVSDEGAAAELYTSDANVSPITVLARRGSGHGGVVFDAQMIVGSARLAVTTGVRGYLDPATASSGNFPVTAVQGFVGLNFTGSDQTAGGTFDNVSAGNDIGYGAYGTATGANGVNYGGRFAASGAFGANWAGRFDGGLWINGGHILADGLPTYADQATAAANIPVNYIYKTASGALRIVV